MLHSEKNPAFHARHLSNVSRSAGAEGFTLVAERARLGCRAFHAEQTLHAEPFAPSVRVRYTFVSDVKLIQYNSPDPLKTIKIIKIIHQQ